MSHRDAMYDTTPDQEAANVPNSTDEVTGHGGRPGGVIVPAFASIVVPNLLPIGEEIPQSREQFDPKDAASGRGGHISR